jgi:glutaredoxin
MAAESLSPGDVSEGLTRRARVVVYHAADCHLCRRALEVVRGAHDSLSFDLREVDITGDPELEAAYREWLPVVEIDGRRRFTYHVHPDSFRRAVAQADT